MISAQTEHSAFWCHGQPPALPVFHPATVLRRLQQTPSAEVGRTASLALANRKGSPKSVLSDRGILRRMVGVHLGPPLLEAPGAGALDFGAHGRCYRRCSHRPPVQTCLCRGHIAGGARGFGPSWCAKRILLIQDAFRNLSRQKLARQARIERLQRHLQKHREGRSRRWTDIQALDLAPPMLSAAFKTWRNRCWSIWGSLLPLAAEADPRYRHPGDGAGASSIHFSYFPANGDFTEDNPGGDRELESMNWQSGGTAAQANLDDTVAALAAITGSVCRHHSSDADAPPFRSWRCFRRSAMTRSPISRGWRTSFTGSASYRKSSPLPISSGDRRRADHKSLLADSSMWPALEHDERGRIGEKIFRYMRLQ